MKSLAVCFLLSIVYVSAYADEESAAVQLFVQDKHIALAEAAQSKLCQKIIQLVQSSNLNSALDRYRKNFPFAGVQQDYRDAVAAGEYLLMTIAAEQKFDTHGGEITAVEIIVGLKRPGNKNSVFTIDQSGRVTSHAMYAGEVYLELEQLVADARR